MEPLLNLIADRSNYDGTLVDPGQQPKLRGPGRGTYGESRQTALQRGRREAQKKEAAELELSKKHDDFKMQIHALAKLCDGVLNCHELIVNKRGQLVVDNKISFITILIIACSTESMLFLDTGGYCDPQCFLKFVQL